MRQKLEDIFDHLELFLDLVEAGNIEKITFIISTVMKVEFPNF